MHESMKNKIDILFEKKYVSDWEIQSDDVISHGRMVGKGAYGTVYKAKMRLHGKMKFEELLRSMTHGIHH